MKAPSEKHLEDWIVANYNDVVYYMGEPCQNWDGYVRYIGRVIGRQVRLPSGICDLVVVAHGLRAPSVAAVEIKAGAIDSKTVAQCLRYMRDLRHMFYEVYLENTEYRYTPLGIFDELNGYHQEISGMVIGSSISDENLIVACESCSIVPVLYSYDPERDSYSFSDNDDVVVEGDDFLARAEIYKQFSRGAIGDAMRGVMKNRWRDEQRRRTS